MRQVKRFFILGLTVCIMNIMCYGYYNPTHNSSKNNYRLEPNDSGFQAMEGVAITYTDSNGFTNKQLDIEEKCILVMGSSQGAGQNVSLEHRFSERLNSMLGYNSTYKVYNVCYSGGLFKDIVHNFQEITEEFPDTERVFIELDLEHLTMTESDFEYAINQISIQECVKGEELSDYSFEDKIKFFFKESVPLGLLMIKQYNAWKSVMTNMEFDLSKEDVYTENQNIENIDMEMHYWEECLQLISEESKAKITIVFHGPVDMEADENTDTSLPAKMKQIEKISNKYNIDVINMIPIFTRNYIEKYELPYGFHNTEFNKGHLNQVGHRLIAEELYRYIVENE